MITFQNAKTIKGEDLGWLTGILYIAPHNIAQRGNICPKATAGCKASCLFSAGRGRFKDVYDARVRKTQLFFDDRQAFIAEVKADIYKAKRKASRLGLRLCIRLNGTSDIAWESLTDIIQSFPDVQFYDYTKILKRVLKNTLSNYHLTFSLSETNRHEALEALDAGVNVAVVFNELPAHGWLGYKVISGDAHDLRFLDPKGVVIGLTPKGLAKKDKTGFVSSGKHFNQLREAA